jgi:predicted alpha/beta-hydrolase family hydrolase
MSPPANEPLSLEVEPALSVSATWQSPADPTACYVLAHGAGAGMNHPFLRSVASQLEARGVATLRYQFPYMERGSKRPDPPKMCHAAVRAAVAEASRRCSAPLFAGGRSFGGRMTSQAQAAAPLPRVQGLAFLGFPLHAARKPSQERADHLFQVRVPMLFLQGTRDELAGLELLEPLVRKLGSGATLTLFQEADHSFHVPARTGRTDAQVLGEAVEALAIWMERTKV